MPTACQDSHRARLQMKISIAFWERDSSGAFLLLPSGGNLETMSCMGYWDRAQPLQRGSVDPGVPQMEVFAVMIKEAG